MVTLTEVEIIFLFFCIIRKSIFICVVAEIDDYIGFQKHKFWTMLTLTRELNKVPALTKLLGLPKTLSFSIPAAAFTIAYFFSA